VGLKFRGFREFARAFDGLRARRRLETEQRRQMARAVALLRGDVIEYINTARHGVPNSPLTILIKGSSRPLVDRGDLRQGIATEVAVSRARVHGAVGVLRRSRGRGGRRLTNVAAALHEGFTVRVTPEVRAAVFAEMTKRRGKKVRVTSGGGARVWRVRGRPFIREPLDDAKERLVEILGDGVETTLEGL
jgi:hypothetical protein